MGIIFEKLIDFVVQGWVPALQLINIALVVFLFSKLLGNHLSHVTEALKVNSDAIKEMSDKVVECVERISRLEGIICVRKRKKYGHK